MFLHHSPGDASGHSWCRIRNLRAAVEHLALSLFQVAAEMCGLISMEAARADLSLPCLTDTRVLARCSGLRNRYQAGKT